MKTTARRLLRTMGWILGVLLLIALALGAYMYSIIPKPRGNPIQLQSELFRKPEHAFPMEGRFVYRSASELTEMIRRREASAVEVVQEFINLIKNENHRFNALIWLRESESLQDAQRIDDMVGRGDTLNRPLLGVPITIKEMFWVKGSPSTMNAKMFGFVAPENAVVVEQLRRAGAVVLGTTNVSFMLGDYQTQGEVYPTGSNPYDTSRTPGGSTGGGAAALAAGFSTLELGSDLGGSIRIPAVFCGLYGLKPTLGAVNITEGTSPDTTTKFSRIGLASAGPLARTVGDIELMWKVLKETRMDPRFQQPVDWRPATNKSLPSFKIAWMDEWKHGGDTVRVGSDVKIHLSIFMDTLRAHGVTVDRTAPDTYDDMKRLFLGTFASMNAEQQPWIIRKFIAQDFKKLDDGSPAFQAFFEAMDDNSDAKWNQLVTKREELKQVWEDFFLQYDFFICPVTYGPAIQKCPQGSSLPGDKGSMPYMEYFPYGYVFNATGHPSLAIPLGLNRDGLPIGVQIVTRYYNEDELLRFARLIEPLVKGFVKPK